MRHPLRSIVPAVAAVTLALAGCDALNPERPTPQPDTEIFGTVLSVERVPDDPSRRVVRIRVGMPRSMSKKHLEEGHQVPPVEEGITAEVTLTPDTVVVVDGRPGDLDRFTTGREVAALPVPGTTMMAGADRVMIEAAYLMDFASYRVWRLPKSLDEIPEGPEDPSRIASAGVEHGPVPVGDGTVLYFAARLRRPWRPGAPWIGARRPGLPEPGEDGVAFERSYRTELGPDGWSAPEPVTFPGTGDAPGVRVTWVDPTETRCLVAVHGADGSRWVGEATRPSPRAPWPEPRRLAHLGEGDADDATFLAGSTTSFAFVTTRGGNPDIYLYHPPNGDAPMPLDPRIDTAGPEWAPRVGPTNQLLFCRGQRQLLFAGGTVRELRPEGPWRIPVVEAAPTADGRWVFAALPRYTPVELDYDIVVMSWDGATGLGAPVPVESWRPAPGE